LRCWRRIRSNGAEGIRCGWPRAEERRAAGSSTEAAGCGTSKSCAGVGRLAKETAGIGGSVVIILAEGGATSIRTPEPSEASTGAKGASLIVRVAKSSTLGVVGQPQFLSKCESV
jgi:hypothetical protein